MSSHGAGGTINYVSEYNGSVMALYIPAGTEVGSYRYSPYGETTPDNNGLSSPAAANNPFRYIGGYQDKTARGEDGYYKLGARYYDGHGHFTQPDAIAGRISDPRTLTSYNYAGGDPVNSSDPSGNSLGSALGDIAGGAIATIELPRFAQVPLVWDVQLPVSDLRLLERLSVLVSRRRSKVTLVSRPQAHLAKTS